MPQAKISSAKLGDSSFRRGRLEAAQPIAKHRDPEIARVCLPPVVQICRRPERVAIAEAVDPEHDHGFKLDGFGALGRQRQYEMFAPVEPANSKGSTVAAVVRIPSPGGASFVSHAGSRRRCGA
uniref:(northern house mosquito) hypothetical protein n=1 Tax=Culex pipiens TaxID=7175 RepID=A0A8D8CH39_CULPI